MSTRALVHDFLQRNSYTKAARSFRKESEAADGPIPAVAPGASLTAACDFFFASKEEAARDGAEFSSDSESGGSAGESDSGSDSDSEPAAAIQRVAKSSVGTVDSRSGSDGSDSSSDSESSSSSSDDEDAPQTMTAAVALSKKRARDEESSPSGSDSGGSSGGSSEESTAQPAVKRAKVNASSDESSESDSSSGDESDGGGDESDSGSSDDESDSSSDESDSSSESSSSEEERAHVEVVRAAPVVVSLDEAEQLRYKALNPASGKKRVANDRSKGSTFCRIDIDAEAEYLKNKSMKFQDNTCAWGRSFVPRPHYYSSHLARVYSALKRSCPYHASSLSFLQRVLLYYRRRRNLRCRWMGCKSE